MEKNVNHDRPEQQQEEEEVSGARNQYHDLPEAEEMDLETIRDPIAPVGAEGQENEDLNKFVVLTRQMVKEDHFDRYRHSCSWVIQSFMGKPGYVATYILHRLLPTTSEDGEGCHLSVRPLRKEETMYSADEVGCHEICLLNKFDSLSSWQAHLSFDSVIKWITYSLAVKDLSAMPQVFMFQKQNGIHQEVTNGRIGEQLTASDPRMGIENQDEGRGTQQTGSLFVMMRTRTVDRNSNVNIDMLLQIMNQLSEFALIGEKGKCIMYDIHTSRNVGPDVDTLNILEIGIWNTMEQYFNEHLTQPYVKQSEQINAAFKENDNESKTFWEFLTPHGLLEPNPDVSFMDEANLSNSFDS